MSHLSQKMFLFVNMAFSMFAGSLIVLAALRLSIKYYESPILQIEMLNWYSLAVGLYLTVLVCIALSAVYPRSIALLNVYLGGIILLFISEISYIAFIVEYTMDQYNGATTGQLPSVTTFLQSDLLKIISAILLMFFILQLMAMILSCVLQKKEYSRRETVDRRTTDRGWQSSDEYSYHANGAGTIVNRGSRQMLPHELLASAPPPPAYHQLHNTPRHI